VLRVGVVANGSNSGLVLEAIFANGSQGPCVLTDTSLSLWCRLLTSGALTSAETVSNFSLRVISWLKTYWTLPAVLDRLHNASTARHAQEDRMYRLLMACMNIYTALGEYDFSIVTSPIYVRCYRATGSSPVSRFLLRMSETSSASMGPSFAPSSSITIDTSSRRRLEHAICELLLTKLRTFPEAWGSLKQERSSSVSPDIVQILSSTCIIASSISSAIDDAKNPLLREVVTLAVKVWNDVCGLVSSLEGDLRQRCLVIVCSSLLRVDPKDAEERASIVKNRQALATPLLEILQQSLAQDSLQNEMEDDPMEERGSFSGQNSQRPIDSDTNPIIRQKVLFATDLHSAVVQLTCRILITELEGRFSEKGDPRVASGVIDYAAGLSAADLIAARQPLTEFFERTPSILRADALRLLGVLAETCLQEDEFERCEAALCFCVDVLASLAQTWTVENEDKLASNACDIYEWYLEIAVGKGIATEEVMLAIARMLTAVSANNSAFGSGMSLPSPRTSLLRLLKAGNHVVQFNITGLVCQVFEGFVLSEHWAIFDDVVASLPADPDRVEGIAVRLFILGKLASRWHTLLRKSVYSVFETAARVPAAMPFAQKCFEDVSDSLDLREPRELFVLFSPQILFTWLEKESLESIPFQAFKYKELLSLFRDVQNEAVGQIAMRASTSHATALARLTGTAWEQMLYDGFVTAEAYCISRDISTPRNDQSKASEAILRKQLGNEAYLKLVQDSFSQIIARLFTIVGDDSGIEKALTKRRSLNAAQTALMEICKRSQSTVVLPKGQQPSFRLKYIFDEVDYLCKRIDRDSTAIWEPSLVVYTCRRLFDSAVPALGPLHACTVIRKVRMVVCLAGQQALKGYPLEMLLHTLRPFLTDFHCSEDALGLFWYLLDHGKPYLESHVSFVASLVVSTFATISSFLASSQDSTTQESHFKSTMNKVQSFRGWMLKYLDAFKPRDVSIEKSTIFSSITGLASGISNEGGNTKGTPQGDLIFLLLSDQTSKDKLLTRTAFVQVMELLCVNFRGAVDPKDDILYLDDDSVRLGPILLALLNKINANPFVVWVAQVVGRAYASRGHVLGTSDDGLLASQDIKSIDDMVQRQSYAGIVDCLTKMLRKDDRRVSGLAERALQLIFTALTAQENSTHLGAVVEKPLFDDLTWTESLCPHIVLGPDVVHKMHALLQSPQQESAQTWASRLAIALCGRNDSDPTLAALPVMLDAVPGLATDILPFIVHIILLAESGGHQPTRHELTTAINETLAGWKDPSKAEHIQLAIKIILYLRHQPIPRENTTADRNLWLEVSLPDAAAASSSCGMHTAALLFLELSLSQQALQFSRTSRRSSVAILEPHQDLVQQVFYSLDDPDFYFGVQEKASLQSVLSKVAREDSAYKNLSFQSALFDSECRLSMTSVLDSQDSDIVGALGRNNLNGIARAVQLQATTRPSSSSGEGVLQVSLNLNQWDLPHLTEQHASVGVVTDTFRALEGFSSQAALINHLDTGLKALLEPITRSTLPSKSVTSNFSGMAVLTELRESLSAAGSEGLMEEVRHQTERARWESQER
jgi:serine-protein kinase ATM